MNEFVFPTILFYRCNIQQQIPLPPRNKDNCERCFLRIKMKLLGRTVSCYSPESPSALPPDPAVSAVATCVGSGDGTGSVNGQRKREETHGEKGQSEGPVSGAVRQMKLSLAPSLALPRPGARRRRGAVAPPPRGNDAPGGAHWSSAVRPTSRCTRRDAESEDLRRTETESGCDQGGGGGGAERCFLDTINVVGVCSLGMAASTSRRKPRQLSMSKKYWKSLAIGFWIKSCGLGLQMQRKGKNSRTPPLLQGLHTQSQGFASQTTRLEKCARICTHIPPQADTGLTANHGT